MNKKSIIIMLHCNENTGYAIASLEHVFLSAARKAGYADENIFWSYSRVFSKNNPNIIECEYIDPTAHNNLAAFINKHNIQTALAFDLGFPCAVIPLLKSAGVNYLISYWGASMSSINSGIKLKLKQLECFFTRNKPDKFIFESAAMQKTATHGRGINKNATDIIYLGVDTKKFFPEYNNNTYTYDALSIAKNRKIAFYSGHMEERKGVRVIIQAAITLVDQLGFKDIHFVICGNKDNQAEIYQKLLENSQARDHVTFAGYRTDIAELMRGSHIGVIASTGWDSFTMSSIEMMASGLPMIVSNLQGLSETIAEQKNGFLIPPGDHAALAEHIRQLAQDSNLAKQFSISSRDRAVQNFSIENQINKFSDLIKKNS